jgi:hypothetical protein
MKKNLLNKNVLRVVSAVLMVCFMAFSSSGQVAGDFRSAATGVWGTIATWQTYDGAAWNAATAIPAGTETITIQAGHTITISSAVTLSGSGYLKNSGSALAFSAGTIAFTGSSTYEHNTATAVALPVTASTTWGVGSTCKITCALGAGTSLANSSQNFHHLIWDPSTQTGTVNVVWVDGLTMGGNLTINNTGSGKVRMTSLTAGVNKAFTITGNLIINGGILESTGSGVVATVTINVTGNISIAAGTLFLVSSSATFLWNLTGNLTITGTGILSKGSGPGSLTFVGSGTHSFNRASGVGAIQTNGTNAMLLILGGTGTLTLGTSVYDGGGNFTVNAGTTLETTHASGLTGNLQTVGIKTLSTAANYIFDGATSQVTSALLPATVNNLTINNASGVTLTAATTVNGTLALTAGTLALGANTLTASGTVTKTSGNIDASAAPMIFGNAAPLTLPVSVYTGAVNSLTMNGAGGITLSDPLTVTNALTLTNGNITIGANDLTAGSFAGAPSASSHVIATTGTAATGYLKSPIVGGGTSVFPIGATATSYDPVSISPSNPVTFGAKVKNSYTNPVGIGYETSLVQREWDLSPSVTPGSTNISFTPHSSAITGANTPPSSACVIGHWNGSVWESVSTAAYAGGAWSLTGYLGTFSPFVVSAPIVSLSVDLQNFTAKAKGTTNVLSWATATERNNASFDIQRSSNGTDFTTIGAVKGNGSKTTISEYSFTDNAPLNGINYYRLRAVETDGKATLSKSVAVVNGKSTTGIVKVYPSVADAILTVETITEGTTVLNVVDVTGKTVLTKTIKETGFSSTTLDISGLSNGLYILSSTSAIGNMTKKFIKN